MYDEDKKNYSDHNGQHKAIEGVISLLVFLIVAALFSVGDESYINYSNEVDTKRHSKACAPCDDIIAEMEKRNEISRQTAPIALM